MEYQETGFHLKKEYQKVGFHLKKEYQETDSHLKKEYQKTAYFSIHRIPHAAVHFHLLRFREEYPNETVGGRW